MEIQNILTLIQAFTENSLTELKVEDSGVKVLLKKDHYMEQPSAAGDRALPAEVVMTERKPPAGKNDMVKPAELPSVQTEARGAQPAAKETGAGPAEISSDHVVVSPLVGIFYSAPSPDGENFVKAGDRVKKGQVLGIIEAMKLMNEIESDYDGVVEAILVSNEDVVEYGQPLFRIR